MRRAFARGLGLSINSGAPSGRSSMNTLEIATQATEITMSNVTDRGEDYARVEYDRMSWRVSRDQDLTGVRFEIRGATPNGNRPDDPGVYLIRPTPTTVQIMISPMTFEVTAALA